MLLRIVAVIPGDTLIENGPWQMLHDLKKKQNDRKTSQALYWFSSQIPECGSRCNANSSRFVKTMRFFKNIILHRISKIFPGISESL